MTDKYFDAYRKLFIETNLAYFNWRQQQRAKSSPEMSDGQPNGADYAQIKSALQVCYQEITKDKTGPRRHFEVENLLFETCLRVRDFAQQMDQPFMVNCETMLRLQ